MPNRHGSTDDYRYGFGGQEKDDEIKGEGNSLNYTYRMYDPRAGRFFAVDPMVHSYPYYSPYQFSGNTPIMSTELEGLEPKVDGNGNLVGYTIMRDIVGPTYIAEYLNDPATQARYGYTLQRSVSWEEVVLQNIDYYLEAGGVDNWKGTNIFDKTNPVYDNMHSEVDDKLNFSFTDYKTNSEQLKELIVTVASKPIAEGDKANSNPQKYLVVYRLTNDKSKTSGGGLGLFEPQPGDIPIYVAIDDFSGTGSGNGRRYKNLFSAIIKGIKGVFGRGNSIGTNNSDDAFEEMSKATKNATEEKQVTYEIQNVISIDKPLHPDNGYRVQTQFKDTTTAEKVRQRVLDDKERRLQEARRDADSLNNTKDN